ncbi:MAG: FlgD immunoglobulin-like domain containing protein [Candidatus Edwardsbacteria bacterium]
MRQLLFVTFILMFFVPILGEADKFKVVATLPVARGYSAWGSTDMGLLVYDCNHNGLNEVITSYYDTTAGIFVVDFFEHQGNNQYQRVFTLLGDVGGAPDVGDIDEDGLTDLVVIYLTKDKTVWVYESPAPDSFPSLRVWGSDPIYSGGTDFCIAPDLDQDGKKEIAVSAGRWDVYECQGDNIYNLVFRTEEPKKPYKQIIEDFDLDGKTEIATGAGPEMCVWENTQIGIDSFAMVAVDSFFIPGRLGAVGKNMDKDEKPEFILGGFTLIPLLFTFRIFEAVGNNSYAQVCSLSFLEGSGPGIPVPFGGSVATGDVNGDSIPEVVFSAMGSMYVYKAFGNDNYVQIWEYHHPWITYSKVKVYDLNKNGYGEIIFSGCASYNRMETVIFEDSAAVGVEELTEQKAKNRKPKLHQNYPNPFSTQTAIRYSLSAISHTTLKIYNIAGQLVKTLVNEPQEPGYYAVRWNGKNESGNSVASGVYFYRLSAGDFTATKRMIVIR